MAAVLKKERWFIESLDRGLRVMAAFGGSRPVLTTSELAASAGVSRASARRIAMTLESLGYLGRTDRNEYFLTPRVLALGTAYLTSHRVGDAVQPILVGLRGLSGRSSSLAVLDGHDIVFVARASATGPMRIHIDLGQRLPAYATAMGRVLLAGLTDAALDKWLSEAKLTPVTRSTITDRDALRAAILRVREAGCCTVDGELGAGIQVLAVPVLDPTGNTVAALNLTTQSALDGDTGDALRFLPQLRQAAAEISGIWQHLHVHRASDPLRQNE